MCGALLDTDQFARFLAANTLLANMDSFLTQVHNYYVYLPPIARQKSVAAELSATFATSWPV